MPKLKPGTVVPTPEEDAAIDAGIASDADTMELADTDIAKLRPAPRGRPRLPNPKRAVKLRLDDDVVEGFRAQGRGWQSLMNKALREALGLPKSH